MLPSVLPINMLLLLLVRAASWYALEKEAQRSRGHQEWCRFGDLSARGDESAQLAR